MSITSYPDYTRIAEGDGNVNFYGTALDAFGRIRVSQPLTLFDSSHRYRDNNLWAEEATGTASSTFNADAGLIEMDIGTASGDELIRETTKVFSYQPGKSLLILSTFVFEPAKANLRQRIGYFGAANGVYLQLADSTVAFVERSSVTGSVVETTVAQSSWNVDPMDGTGPSGVTLDISKAQILFTDIEWLGLGTVRCGFVVDGKFIHCHSFHHANLITSTYITTASLPLRYEITNTDTTASASTLKQVCSSVISEGGYQLQGIQQAVSIPVTAPVTLTTAGTAYPVISIRLKASPDRLDAVVILSALSLLATTTDILSWKVVASATTTGGTWVSAGTDSAVEYNITGTATSGGRILASGYVSSTNQSTGGIDIPKDALFKFQLERDSLAGTPYELSLVVTADANSATCLASMDWEEISR